MFSFPCWTCIQTRISALTSQGMRRYPGLVFKVGSPTRIQTVEAGSEKSAVELPGAPTLHGHAVPTGVATIVTLLINQSIPRGAACSHTGNKGWCEVMPQIPLSTQQRCGEEITSLVLPWGFTALEALTQAL